MSQFKRQRRSNEVEAATATARLPGLEIEIVHRLAVSGQGEQLSIHLQAVPSFEAFSRYFEAADPFALWTEMTRLVWLPWLGVTRASMLPWNLSPLLPKPGTEAAPSSHRPPSTR